LDRQHEPAVFTFGFGLLAEWVGILPALWLGRPCHAPVALWVSGARLTHKGLCAATLPDGGEISALDSFSGARFWLSPAW
jgi:hypothetical protein